MLLENIVRITRAIAVDRSYWCANPNPARIDDRYRQMPPRRLRVSQHLDNIYYSFSTHRNESRKPSLCARPLYRRRLRTARPRPFSHVSHVAHRLPDGQAP